VLECALLSTQLLNKIVLGCSKWDRSGKAIVLECTLLSIQLLNKIVLPCSKRDRSGKAIVLECTLLSRQLLNKSEVGQADQAWAVQNIRWQDKCSQVIGRQVMQDILWQESVNWMGRLCTRWVCESQATTPTINIGDENINGLVLGGR
jgi:hypothetical protein